MLARRFARFAFEKSTRLRSGAGVVVGLRKLKEWVKGVTLSTGASSPEGLVIML